MLLEGNSAVTYGAAGQAEVAVVGGCGTSGTDSPLTGAPLASSATTTIKQMLSMVPDEREGRNPSHRRRRAMRQTQINRKPRAVAARLRRQREQVLPVSLRDPQVVRAKDLQRRLPP